MNIETGRRKLRWITLVKFALALCPNETLPLDFNSLILMVIHVYLCMRSVKIIVWVDNSA